MVRPPLTGGRFVTCPPVSMPAASHFTHWLQVLNDFG
jgi:hypothetical protein